MNKIYVLGRYEEDDLKVAPSSRAETMLAQSTSVEFSGGANGKVQLQWFRSVDKEDRGGAVLRILIDDFGQAFIPYARNVDNGVEVHIAGEIEAAKFLSALKKMVESLNAAS